MRTRAGRVATAGVCALMFTSGHRIAAQDQRIAILNADRATAELSRDSGSRVPFPAACTETEYCSGPVLPSWPEPQT